MRIQLIIFAAALCIGTTGTCYSQYKELYPAVGPVRDLSEAAQKRYARASELWKKDRKDLSEEEQKESAALSGEFDETCESFWDITGCGCSWYCGGGPYEVKASSCLKPNGKITYDARNAHDFSFKTAWIEGEVGCGEGEYLEYYFENESPRLHTVIIYNGYLKSEKAWFYNSRVKTLALDVNGEPYARLNLKDTPAQQSFMVGLLGHREDGGDLVLRFTIEDVYPGYEYEDTAITQIYFDGTDVHCLAPGTEILMADMRLKKIEDIKPGDEVAFYDRAAAKLDKSTVGRVCSPVHDGMVEYILESGRSVVATADHPFLVEGKGWSSYAPEKTGRYKGMADTKKIAAGDRFVVVDSDNKISVSVLKEIRVINDSIRTYTISKLGKGDNFIANGMVAGVEEL